jgi:hypothetical protein
LKNSKCLSSITKNREIKSASRPRVSFGGLMTNN